MTEGVVETGTGGSACRITSLAEMRSGETGRIVQIDAGHGLSRKLNSLGIRVGKQVTKLSAQWIRGPVLLQQGNTKVAIGFGMACRVFVELTPKEEEK